MDDQMEDLKSMKNKLTLDFNAPVSYAKKAKLKTCILESPDLKMLKLGSPELERMIMQQNGLITPTPSAALPYLLKQEEEATDEREQYAQGFVEALKKLQESDKPEPSQQTQSKPSSVAQPINMADQERIKLERKRQRNRIAASKCRMKKLERISVLEDKVRNLKGENGELSVVASKLRDQVCSLKQQIMDHVNYGCQVSTER